MGPETQKLSKEVAELREQICKILDRYYEEHDHEEISNHDQFFASALSCIEKARIRLIDASHDLNHSKL